MRPRINRTLPINFTPSSEVLHTALPREEAAIRLLSVTLFVLVLTYITLVSMSIVNVIARTEAEEHIVSLRATVGELEHDYFALAEGVTAENGDELGLTAVSDIHYVHTPGATAAAKTAGGL